jgi:hypothetical protein
MAKCGALHGSYCSTSCRMGGHSANCTAAANFSTCTWHQVSSEQLHIVNSMRHLRTTAHVRRVQLQSSRPPPQGRHASWPWAQHVLHAMCETLQLQRACKGAHRYSPTGGGRSSNTRLPFRASPQTHACSARSILSMSMKTSSCAIAACAIQLRRHHKRTTAC